MTSGPGIQTHVWSSVSAVPVPDGELGVERPGQVAGGPCVSGEPPGHVDVADDVRGIVPPRRRVVEQGGGAESVVVVAVCVHDVADGQVGQPPQLLHHPGTVGEQPGVDDSRPFGPEDDGGVAETGEEVDAGGDPARPAWCPRRTEGLGTCGQDGVFRAAHAAIPICIRWLQNVSPRGRLRQLRTGEQRLPRAVRHGGRIHSARGGRSPDPWQGWRFRTPGPMGRWSSRWRPPPHSRHPDRRRRRRRR